MKRAHRLLFTARAFAGGRMPLLQRRAGAPAGAVATSGFTPREPVETYGVLPPAPVTP